MDAIALVAITVVAVGAFTVLQLMARSRQRREPGEPDWGTFTPSSGINRQPPLRIMRLWEKRHDVSVARAGRA